ncbi:MAG: hypothetical protein KatS3mg031_0805 [Chitinophagales bacterium]|nr:MAG: hypothetical protein KatS3mg031_0805 [Chitinophagales bacterium]
MKFSIALILAAIISLVLQWFLPWWSLVVAAFLTGFILVLPPWQSFIAGFIGTALVWWVYALIIDIRTQSILSEKIAPLFHLSHPALLILLCGASAGLIGGFALLSGSECRRMIISDNATN